MPEYCKKILLATFFELMNQEIEYLKENRNAAKEEPNIVTERVTTPTLLELDVLIDASKLRHQLFDIRAAITSYAYDYSPLAVKLIVGNNIILTQNSIF